MCLILKKIRLVLFPDNFMLFLVPTITFRRSFGRVICRYFFGIIIFVHSNSAPTFTPTSIIIPTPALALKFILTDHLKKQKTHRGKAMLPHSLAHRPTPFTGDPDGLPSPTRSLSTDKTLTASVLVNPGCFLIKE